MTVRRSERSPSVLWLPVAAPADCRLTLRVDPGPPAVVAPLNVAVNGARVATLSIQRDETRIGAYDVTVPGRLLRAGSNRLELGPPGFVLWYVRVEPLTEGGSAR